MVKKKLTKAEPVSLSDTLVPFRKDVSANTFKEALAVFSNNPNKIVSVELEGKDIVFTGLGKGVIVVKHRD
jgi:hypothetical protein